MFDDVVCTRLFLWYSTPVEQATCTAGAVVPSTVTLPTTAGITYSMDPEDLGDGTEIVTVTVTAVLADGFGGVSWWRWDARGRQRPRR